VLVHETGVKITIEDGEEFENLCMIFCHVIYQLKKLHDKNIRKSNIELSCLVMETLYRQFSEKVEKQYRIDK
jgi:hypothetical protein